MDLPQLNNEQLEQVRDFFSTEAASVLFQRLEAQTLADWILSNQPDEREKCWHSLQAILGLQSMLRNATADKKLTERSRNALATNRTE